MHPSGSSLSAKRIAHGAQDNEIIWNFMHFDHLDLFRISDFGFLLLFVLGVLCVYARVIVIDFAQSS